MGKYHLVKFKLEIKDQREIRRILTGGKYATLAMCRNNEPYIVTLSYGYDVERQALYFHCAKRGLKLEFLKGNPLVCGTVVEDLGYRTGKCSHKFNSVVFWGNMRRIVEFEQKKHAYSVMINQLEKDPVEVNARIFKNEVHYNRALVYRLDITEITGKSSQQ
jgi:nitroimidazol reductase NimA-like FMN-containing flavoprotein (pyridoxamine 5'-phosphate oxidase superfamily)